MLGVVRRIPQNVIDHHDWLHGFPLDIASLLRDPVERQDLGGHRFQTFVLPQDRGQQIRIHATVTGQLNGNPLPRQGGSEVVRYITQQVCLAIEQTAQLLGHGIEGCRQSTHLVPSTRDAITDPKRIVPSSNGTSGGFHMFKGAGNQTRNPPTGKRDDNERQPQFQETEQLGIKPALAIQAGPGHQAMVRTDLNNCRFLPVPPPRLHPLADG